MHLSIKKLSPTSNFMISLGGLCVIFGILLFGLNHWNEFELGTLRAGEDLSYDVAFTFFLLGIAVMNLGVRKNTITRFKKLNEELQKINENLLKKTEALEKSNTELDDFAYIASHDLKEPLRGIANYSRFILEDYAPNFDDDGKKRLETLAQLPKQMEALINDLLLYSRVGRSDLSLVQVNLNKSLDQVLALLKPMIDEKKAEVKIPKTLPVVFGDKTRLYDVFQNLIVNAIKYNSNPQPYVEIGYQEESDPKTITLYVKDNGIGIPREHHESIFRMFKRLHPRHAYGGGSGAGLSIVKKIVEKHQGKIWVESEPGQGSTFYFTLKKT